MLQNVTLSAEKDLIERARRRAEAKDTTLNAEFRRWLEQYVESPQVSTEFETLMERFRYASAGKTFSRDEANERD
jgi:hypothetical protein